MLINLEDTTHEGMGRLVDELHAVFPNKTIIVGSTEAMTNNSYIISGLDDEEFTEFQKAFPLWEGRPIQ